MPRFIEAPVVIEAAGTKPKLIEELVGGSPRHVTKEMTCRFDSW